MTELPALPMHFRTSGNPSKFLIQDPLGLRHVVQPVVGISRSGDNIVGYGTCFQVSPWLWLTADHVISHNGISAFPPDEFGAVGFSPGVVYGRVQLELQKMFGPIVQVSRFRNLQQDGSLPGPRPPSIVIDAASLRVNVDSIEGRLVSPLVIGRDLPKVGDQVVAIGFPILGTKYTSESTQGIFEEAMYGADGVVRAIHTCGTSASKPWPTLEIEGDWEAGMSGGPVVNMNGDVVGLVSSSIAPTGREPGIGFAIALSQIDLRGLAPELDLDNPGWFHGWMAFRSGSPVHFFGDKQIAEAWSQLQVGDEIKAVSHHPKSGDWIET